MGTFIAEAADKHGLFSHMKLRARDGRTELVPGSVYKNLQGLLPV